ncbi:MAG: YfhO family protein [Clostridia bacterium]|nr:YfhO family protein [Clostridia bacterium]
MKDSRVSVKENGFRQALPTICCVLLTVLLLALMWLITGKASIVSGMTNAQRIACSGGIAALMGSLMCVLSNALSGQSVAPENRPNWYYPVMSGVLSLGAMCVAYTFVGMWPFGTETGMVVDMHHQYAPLLAGLRDNILTGDLSVYSWEVGLGANYISLFGYYLASPLNILLILFPKALLAEGILVITLIKNALCGAFFGLCVQHVYRRKGLIIPLVSVMYSMMMYLLAYSWNIMWLDVVMVLPLAVLGFEHLMKTGRYLPYVLSLTYCLYANYYIGFMLCIFLVFYYVAFVLRQRLSGREFAVSFGRFAGFSVLGAALAAAMLIPVFLALKQTSAAENDLPKLTNTIDIFELIGRHLAGTTPTIRSGNLPNMYCGVLSAICIPLFATNKGIPLRRRAAYMGVWLVLLITFVINVTDLAWHGLHSPNDLPYRFSFVYSFFVLLMAFEVLSHLQDITSKQILSVFACGVAYLVFEEHFGEDKTYGFNTIYINLLIMAVYAVVLLAIANRKLVKQVAYALLLLCVTAEMTLNSGYALVRVNKQEYYTNHNDYVDNNVTALLHETVDRMQEVGDRVAEGDFYRLEFLPRRTCVDTALYQYRGLTTFSSSNYYTTTKLLGGLGYAVNGVNSHLYRSFVPFTDSLLGIKYVALEVKLTDHQQLKYLETLNKKSQSYSIYENTDALALGYMVSDDVKDYSYTKYDPFASQNELFTAITGIDEELYTLHPFEGSAGGSTSGETWFQIKSSGSSASGVFTAKLTESGQTFIYVDCSAAKTISVASSSSSWSVTPHEPFIIDGGFGTVGDAFTMNINSDIACSGNFYVATMNADVYERGMAILRESQLEVSSFSNTRVKGSVNAVNAGTMMTSIPYDAGWTVKVDGKRVPTYAVDKGFLAFAVESGNHTVTMTYSPQGFALGVVISVLALAVLFALIFQKRWMPLVQKIRAKSAKSEK